MALQKSKVRIFRDENGKTGIQTTCITAEDFIAELASKLNVLIPQLEDEEALGRWLRQSFEVVAKLKGYKSDVQEERVLYSGDSFVSDNAEIVIRERELAPV